jgi:hypothetical protein
MEALLLSSNFSDKLNVSLSNPLTWEEQKSIYHILGVLLLNIPQPENVTP